MNEVTTVSAADPAPPAGVAPRRPVKAVQMLLPVWGHRFIRQFLEFCLPTLLAPGNVPALATTLPCCFVIMTSANDVAAASTRMEEMIGSNVWPVKTPYRDETALLLAFCCSSRGGRVSVRLTTRFAW